MNFKTVKSTSCLSKRMWALQHINTSAASVCVYLDFVNVATGGDVGPTRRTVLTSLAMEATKLDYINKK